MSPTTVTQNIEFHVEIGHDQVQGLVGEPLKKFPTDTVACDLDIDPLMLETAELLEQWLNGWESIQLSPARAQKVLKPETFKILGNLLWRLVLTDGEGNDNAVGEKLRSTVLNADPKSPVRLVISFDDTADPKLRALPWEFLCMSAGNRDRFLAAETAMLLTRYIPRDVGRATVKSATGELRVQFIAAVPDRELDLAYASKDVVRLAKAVDTVQGVVVNEPIDAWNPEAIRSALTDPEKPCHIVHVVGVCRGAPGKPEMYLADNEGHGMWMDPKPLVDALTPDGAERPQLVILQLCDYKDGDATENFERLAPRLIERNVPAVLATQYAGSADQVGVGAKFYERLYKREKIGEAVQNTRHEMLDMEQLNRQFGTPVLYLQADGPLLTAPPVLNSTSGPAQPSKAATPINNGTIRAAMMQALDKEKPLSNPEDKKDVEDWVKDQDFRNDLRYAVDFLRSQHRFSEARLKPAFRVMLDGLKRLDGGAPDARS